MTRAQTVMSEEAVGKLLTQDCTKFELPLTRPRQLMASLCCSEYVCIHTRITKDSISALAPNLNQNLGIFICSWSIATFLMNDL